MNINSKIDNLISSLVHHLGVDKISYEFSNNIGDDSRLIIKPNIKILINERFKNDFYESAKALVHEYRHWFQINWVYYMDDTLSRKWKNAYNKAISLENADILNNIDDSTTYAMQEIEIDAFAFTKYYLEKYEGLVVVHPNEQYEKIISKYIELNKNIM